MDSTGCMLCYDPEFVFFFIIVLKFCSEKYLGRRAPEKILVVSNFERAVAQAANAENLYKERAWQY